MSNRYDFPPILRGNSQDLVVFLRIRDVETLLRSSFPFANFPLTWTISPPGRDVLTRNGTDGLDLDPKTGRATNALTKSQTLAMPLGAVPYRISTLDDQGNLRPLLSGSLFFGD